MHGVDVEFRQVIQVVVDTAATVQDHGQALPVDLCADLTQRLLDDRAKMFHRQQAAGAAAEIFADKHPVHARLGQARDGHGGKIHSQARQPLQELGIVVEHEADVLVAGQRPHQGQPTGRPAADGHGAVAQRGVHGHGRVRFARRPSACGSGAQ